MPVGPFSAGSCPIPAPGAEPGPGWQFQPPFLIVSGTQLACRLKTAPACGQKCSSRLRLSGGQPARGVVPNHRTSRNGNTRNRSCLVAKRFPDSACGLGAVTLYGVTRDRSDPEAVTRSEVLDSYNRAAVQRMGNPTVGCRCFGDQLLADWRNR